MSQELRSGERYQHQGRPCVLLAPLPYGGAIVRYEDAPGGSPAPVLAADLRHAEPRR